MKTQFGWTIGMVEQGRTNTCDGVRCFLQNPLMLVIQCLLIFELIPSVQAQTPEDPNANRFDYSITNGTITITRYTGTGGDVTIPSMIDGLPVTSIGPWAFVSGIRVTSVVIPERVLSIGERSFSSCNGLTNVMIGNGVTSIGEGAFANCRGLATVMLPDSLTNIGAEAFWWCTGLTSVAIPCSVTNIGGHSFEYCTGLTTVKIGDSVTSTGEATFRNCWNLTGVTLGKSVTSIGERSFFNCTSLATITIPNSVIDIGNLAFGECTSLRSVSIPDSITSIALLAFTGCANLDSVYFQGNSPGHAMPALSRTTATLYYLPGTTGWGATFAGRPTAMWIRVIPNLVEGTADEPLRLLTHSPGPASVRVQRSANLRDWEEWQTVTREGGPRELQDDEAATRPYRFYRGIEE